MSNVIKTSKFRILVVDDDKDIVQTVKGNLELDGYEVLTALDGHTCLQMVRNNRPDLIILDLNLPDIDGIKAWYRITMQDYLHCSNVIFC